MRSVLVVLVALAAGLLGLGWAFSALAQDRVPPSPSVLLQQSPDAIGVFALQPNGSVRHLQSGLICRPDYGDLKLAHLEVFASDFGKGADVGCDYGRFDAQGRALSKLTVFVTRASAGETVESLLERRRQEVRKSWPDADERGPAIVFGDHSQGPSAWSGVRSAEFAVKFGDTHYLSDLVVVLQGGWEIEIRGTYPTDIQVAPNTDAKTAAGQVVEAAGPAVALEDALASVGRGVSP